MNILHVTPSFYPATFWGGPIWSTKAICDGIAATPGLSVRVLTTDAGGPERGDRVVPETLPYRVDYARRVAGHSIAPGLLAKLPAAMRWADVVHLTGTYSFPTLPVLVLARLMGKPLVWSPRGALQATTDWDAAPHRRLKHRFEQVADMLRPRGTVLHVTSQKEATQSTARLAGIRTMTIPNAVAIPNITKKTRGPGLRLLFLGRLHPKKGLDLLLDAMDRLPEHVSLDIYGTGDPKYCADLRSRLGANTVLHGHADDAVKARAFANADLFVLPSFSENFAIAVAEALAHGVPVLTTTATPWGQLDAKGCGRCMDIARDDLAVEIQALAKKDLADMGRLGRAWIAQDFSRAAMIASFLDLYRFQHQQRPQVVPA